MNLVILSIKKFVSAFYFYFLISIIFFCSEKGFHLYVSSSINHLEKRLEKLKLSGSKTTKYKLSNINIK